MRRSSKRVLLGIIVPICILVISVVCIAIVSQDARNFIKEKIIKGRVGPDTLNTGLPVIIINTQNKEPVSGKEKNIDAVFKLSDPVNKSNNFTAPIEIRGRGNTTWTFNKKPYRIRFNEKQSMFGLTGARNWILLANHQDTTFIMNTVTFELGRRFDFPYTNHSVHVELVLNGVYEGSYVLTEQIQVCKGRVDIGKGNGFLVELDNNYDEEPKFETALLGLPVMIKYPEDMPDASGYDFARDSVNVLEAALFDESFPESGYRDLIDMDTLVDFILINEIVKNIELQFPRSVYMYKDSSAGAKIRMGPLWDFDYGFDFDGVFFQNAEGMYINSVYRDGKGRTFFSRFFDDPVFLAKYKERWNNRYRDIIGMVDFIDEMAGTLSESQKANHAVWHWWRIGKLKRKSYEQEIDDMKTWWLKRSAYLNEEINKF